MVFNLKSSCIKSIVDPLTTAIIENLMDKQIPYDIQSSNNTTTSFLNETTIVNSMNRLESTEAYIFYNNVYVYYKIKDKYYVDIHHIISNLDFSLNNCTYKEVFRNHSKDIEQTIWKKNLNNKPIKKELISLESMSNLILENTCAYATTHKMELYLNLIILILLLNTNKTPIKHQ